MEYSEELNDPVSNRIQQQVNAPDLKQKNKARARKLISEALSGAAVRSGTASPEQSIESGATTLGPSGPLTGGPGAPVIDFNRDLFNSVESRFPMDTPQSISSRNQGGDINSFMGAISDQESGGDPNAVNSETGAHGQFQIMPSNWSNWAKEAGLSADAPRTQENQNLVARNKMQQYYDDFGSWDAVAVAWFAGPGRAKRYLEGDKSVLDLSDGNMTVGEYIAKMNRGMGSQ